jgi:hypothetical protein
MSWFSNEDDKKEVVCHCHEVDDDKPEPPASEPSDGLVAIGLTLLAVAVLGVPL